MIDWWMLFLQKYHSLFKIIDLDPLEDNRLTRILNMSVAHDCRNILLKSETMFLWLIADGVDLFSHKMILDQ